MSLKGFDWLRERIGNLYCLLGGAVISVSAVVSLLLPQYAILRRRGLPKTDLGTPYFGYTQSILSNGMETWLLEFAARHYPLRAVLTYYFGRHAVVISHSFYNEHIRRLERAGNLVPSFPPTLQALIGTSSLLALPAGTATSKQPVLHRRLHAKVVKALSSSRILGRCQEPIQRVVRSMLESLVNDSQGHGQARLEPAVHTIAFAVAAQAITGIELGHELSQMHCLAMHILGGLNAVPVDLGAFSAYGRALQARSHFVSMMEEILARPLETGTALSELLSECEDGSAGFSGGEVVDTVLSMFLAGQRPMEEALMQMVADLADHSAERILIQGECQAGFQTVEQDSATLRFVKESLRRTPPVSTIRRRSLAAGGSTIDLGSFGKVPGFVQLTALLTPDDHAFSAARWELSSRSDDLLAFGGSQPHACVGRQLALLVLQIFARELCGFYAFELCDRRPISKMGMRAWRHGCPIRLWRL